MKTLEVFLDESGDITRPRPMNISGIAVVAPGVDERERFHERFFYELKSEGLTAGVCEAVAGNSVNPDYIADNLSLPARFIPKRPETGDWEAFWEVIDRMSSIAEECARDHGVTLIGFSLQFPASTNRRWGASDPCIDLLLDRPYGECLKDVLELLLFETPRIRQTITHGTGCSLAFDLPTRTLASSMDPANHARKVDTMWSEWGLQARAQNNRDQPEIVAGTMEPGDAIEILTSALNRRREHSAKLLVERARCCKLVPWSQWEYRYARDEKKRRINRYWAIASSPRPRQIHFLADYLSNGLFNNQIPLNRDPYRIWFDRGFTLSSAGEGADEWLTAVRAFANGDRVAAFQSVEKLCNVEGHQQTKTYQFFRRSAKGWPQYLNGAELRRLFAEA